MVFDGAFSERRCWKYGTSKRAKLWPCTGSGTWQGLPPNDGLKRKGAADDTTFRSRFLEVMNRPTTLVKDGSSSSKKHNDCHRLCYFMLFICLILHNIQKISKSRQNQVRESWFLFVFLALSRAVYPFDEHDMSNISCYRFQPAMVIDFVRLVWFSRRCRTKRSWQRPSVHAAKRFQSCLSEET